MNVGTAILLLLAACSEAPNAEEKKSAEKPSEETHTPRFEIEERSYGHLLRTFNGEQRTDTNSYKLLKESVEQASVDGRRIRVPVERIVCLSTTHVGMLKALGASHRIVGSPNRKLLYDSTVRRRMERGAIESIGTRNSIDTERIIALKAELLVDDGMSGGSEGRRQKLRSAGIEVLDVLDWKETHPLSRAEWLKVFGVLVGKKERADSILRTRKAAYDSITRIASSSENKPEVLCNALHRGTWFVPGGESFMAGLIADAGGRYPWQDNGSSGGVPKSLEEVIARAGDADVWLNPGNANSLQELLEEDRRIQGIRAFEKEQVYNNDRRNGPNRGNDYWESGPVRPDRILADLVKILHPRKMPEHEFHYFRRLPSSQ